MPTKTAQNSWQNVDGNDFLQMTNEGGGVLAGIDPKGFPYGALASLNLSSTTTLTSSQIKSLHATPVQVLAAPSDKTKRYVVLGSFLQLTAGTVPFGNNTGGALNLSYTSTVNLGTTAIYGVSTDVNSGSYPSAIDVTSSFSVEAFGANAPFNGASIQTSLALGAPIFISYLNGGGELTNGNGTLSVTLFYILI